jgi:hypothetical protein
MAATAADSHHGMRFAFVEGESLMAVSVLAITVKRKRRHRCRQRLSQKEEGG